MNSRSQRCRGFLDFAVDQTFGRINDSMSRSAAHSYAYRISLLVTALLFFRPNSTAALELRQALLDPASLHRECQMAEREGRLNDARRLCERALDLQECTAPDSLETAAIQLTLGSILRSLDERAMAGSLFEQSFEAHQKLAPDSLLLAASVDALGTVTEDPLEAERLIQAGLELRERLAPDSEAVAGSLMNLGTLRPDGDLNKSAEYYWRALTIYQKIESEGLKAALVFYQLGLVEQERKNLDAASAYFERALEIQERLAPDTLAIAQTLTNIGITADMRGDLDTAERYYRLALPLVERLAPDNSYHEVILVSLGLVAEERGDLNFAEQCFRCALVISKRIDPEGPRVASNLNNLGLVAMDRGDLEVAQDLFERSLRIREQSDDWPNRIQVLTNLGLTAWARFDLIAAERYLKMALEVQERTAPTAIETSTILNQLAGLALERNDPVAADTWLSRAAKVAEGFAPDSSMVAQICDNRGIAALLKGDRKTATRWLTKALQLYERLAPESLKLAGTLDNLAEVGKADLSRAISLREHAQKIRRQLAPGSLEEARGSFQLGLLRRKAGDNRKAEVDFRTAIDALEHQIVRLGGSQDNKAEFRERFRPFYRALLEILLEQGQKTEAFQILERSRARSFLALLAERELAFEGSIPPDLNATRSELARDYDRILGELGELSPIRDASQIARFQEELKDIHERYEKVVSAIRLASPRLASLTAPEPLNVDGTKAALDPGTLLLSYSIGQDKSQVFALASDAPVEVRNIPMGEEELRSTVEAFRQLMASASAESLLVARRRQLDHLGQRLFRLLIGPVTDLVARSNRILFIPDGPLHLLPWGALVRDDATSYPPEDRWKYLAEWKPLHIAMSATVYAELRNARRSADHLAVTAFGDPVYPSRAANPITDVHVRAMKQRGFDLSPLPGSRIEVEQIDALLNSSEDLLYLGAEATEEHAKSLPSNTHIVHFATHAIFDERFPLNSAVVLSIPERSEKGGDNGLLQAWEIFDQVRVDANLVVLSACESGLGRELGGEGLIGLTRAFQYAGARSVMASLWKISDRTTAELMVRFYKHLKRGLPKDEALRAAQLELIRRPIQARNQKGSIEEIDASAPYYWAAFQIYGDWQ
jgi:CHAT domain-containing protein/Tfp pilus assembly protein PilF